MTVHTSRFGPEARAFEAELKAVSDDRLEGLLTTAATCKDLASFRKHLPSHSRKRKR